MLTLALDVSLAALAISLALCFVRLGLGPAMADRILALDTMYVNAIAFLVIYGIRIDEAVYFEAALLIAMFGFVGTVALAKYLLRGDIIE
ncbi:MAG TPA: K+/H+ antiporter subunit F [Burkholderiales bacterium]|nr:K+/H+ antiporter subunit F [Burkholderiales bacterium]